MSPKNTLLRAALALAVILGLLAAALRFAVEQPTAPAAAGSSSDLLYAPPAEGFKRVTEPRAFSFPADHGPHPEYQTEWWYYTGNLKDPDGRHFGYQLTFFRQGLSAEPISRTSQWAARDAYMAHFTVTDVADNAFYPAERLVRGGAGLAGAQGVPFKVFVEDWSSAGTGDEVTLFAANDGISITLDLKTRKPPTLQGDRGMSQKSSAKGDASYYYSLTNMSTSGSINIKGKKYNVIGTSWFDREWSTKPLDMSEVGWNWFGLHLSDGRDLMWLQVRKSDGTLGISQGSITDSDKNILSTSNTILLESSDVQITELSSWQSSISLSQYPSHWRIIIPSQSIAIEIKPLISDQELRLNTSIYWEGAVSISGSIEGYGYIELTGYHIQ